MIHFIQLPSSAALGTETLLPIAHWAIHNEDGKQNERVDTWAMGLCFFSLQRFLFAFTTILLLSFYLKVHTEENAVGIVEEKQWKELE